jgi:molecular chaperone DnaK (HSP70)
LINTLTTLPSVFDAKRLIGRKFSDAEVQSDLKHFPFKVIDKTGKPYIRVQYRGEDKEFVSLIISQPILIAVLTLSLVPRGDLLHGLDQDEGDR